MNTSTGRTSTRTRINHATIGCTAAVTFFAVVACGVDAEPPTQSIGVKASASPSEQSHATEHSGWMRQGDEIGSSKAPPDSRP